MADFAIAVGRRRIDAHAGAISIGHLLFAMSEPGAIFITEIDVAPVWRRHGVATALLDALVADNPDAYIVVSDRDTNSDEGNALFDAYARQHPGAIEFAGG